jgi:diaminopimelate epimerase
MHGLGNDYVYVETFERGIADAPGFARFVSDRHFGIGGDGLILLAPPVGADSHVRMEMYNADGSRAQMCGNGIRCVARLAYEQGRASGRRVRIDTDVGLREIGIVLAADGSVDRVDVDMGPPGLRRGDLPLRDGAPSSEPFIDRDIIVDGQRWRGTAVSIGNPHLVLRIDAGPIATRLDELDLVSLGPRFEQHPWFPERTNTEFVEVISPREVAMRVWERGSGETLACGTGACAVAVAAALNGWCEREVVVRLRGGDLSIRWAGDAPDGRVWMSGPATRVFEGVLG